MLNNQDQVRVKNSARNIAVSAMFQTILGVISFVERTVFIKCLSPDYLGLNSLFSNILFVLSIAELGIGSTIAFALYKPLAENDDKKILSYMLFFKKAYRIIGSIIIFIGLLISPFVKFFVTSENEIASIQQFFIIYLFAIGLTYFFSYKQILIEADQKKYINQIGICGGSILQAVFQIVVLITTRNYALYIFVFLIFNVGKSIFLSKVANRLYPIIKQKRSDLKFDEAEKNKITSNIKAMCFHKFGEVVIGSTDSILISSIVDIKYLGLYANYQIIINALVSAMRIFYSSMLASIGNMCVTEDSEKVYSSFKTLNFANYILFSYLSVLILNLIQPVISIWLGAKYLLPDSTVFLVSLSFFLSGTRNMILNYHDAYGLFWADKYKRVIEAVVNLVVSLFLGLEYGLNGIFLGTITSNLVGFGIEGYVVYKYSFHKPFHMYIRLYIKQVLVTLFISSLTYLCCHIFKVSSLVIGLLVNLLMCLIIPVSIYLLLYRKEKNFIAVKDFALRYLRLRKRKSA